MAGRLTGARSDLVLSGDIIPSLGWSNFARDTWLDAKMDPSIPAVPIVTLPGAQGRADWTQFGMLAIGRAHIPGQLTRRVTPLNDSALPIDVDFNNLYQHRCCAPPAAAAKSPERRSTIDAGMQVASVPADRPAIPGRRALNH